MASREYGKVAPQFWTGETGRALRKLGADVQLAALYLVTCGSANMIGLYYLPVALMAHEMGSPFEGASKALLALREAGFCEVDEARDLVWVREMARFQVGADLKAGDKRVAFIEAQLAAHAPSPLAAAFRRKYHGSFNLRRPVVADANLSEAPSHAPTEGAAVGPLEAPSKGHREPLGMPLGMPESSEQRAVGERDTPRARVTPLVARRKLYAAFEWARGCVPQDLHADLVAKLGGDSETATQRLLTFYTEVARTWPEDAPIAGSDWDFWRARFAETFGPPRGARPADARPGRGARDVVGPRPRTFADDAWGQVLARLETLLNRHAFLTWFRDTRLVSATTDRLEVLVTDDSTRDWIRRHYAEQLTEALARAGRAGIELVLVTEAELPQAVQA
jgi:hypothetical protein